MLELPTRGHRRDPETGLVWMRHRHYSPTLGRFMSSDPLGSTNDPMAAGNAYCYGGADPIRLSDRLGLQVDYVKVVRFVDMETMQELTQPDILADPEKQIEMGAVDEEGTVHRLSPNQVDAVHKRVRENQARVDAHNNMLANLALMFIDMIPDAGLGPSPFAPTRPGAPRGPRTGGPNGPSAPGPNGPATGGPAGPSKSKGDGPDGPRTGGPDGPSDVVPPKGGGGKGGPSVPKGPTTGPKGPKAPASDVIPASVKDDLKKVPCPPGATSGSYTIIFVMPDGSIKLYHGKGNKKRARRSARERAVKNDADVVDIDWTPAPSDKQAFIDEWKRQKEGGGTDPDKVFNDINSPRKKIEEAQRTQGGNRK